MYAAPAWWGFTSADDRKRLAGFTRRGVRLNLCRDEEGKGTYTWYSASSWIITSVALRYGTYSQRISQFYLHSYTFNLHSEWAIPAFAFPDIIVGTHLLTQEGSKAELAWVAGYVVRQFTSPIPVLTGLNVAQLRWSRPTSYRYTKLTKTRLVGKVKTHCFNQYWTMIIIIRLLSISCQKRNLTYDKE